MKRIFSCCPAFNLSIAENEGSVSVGSEMERQALTWFMVSF